MIVRGPTYFSQGDEKAFFEWLASISCVDGVSGRSRDLHITLKRQPGDAQLRELIALLYRYGMDMTPLAALKTGHNAHWFAENKRAFWHHSVFSDMKT